MINQIQPKVRNSFLLINLLSLFFVIFCWNFFKYFVDSVGFNFTIFALCVLGLFCYIVKDKNIFSVKNIFWIVPYILMALSFSIYENPFVKAINLFVIPVYFFVFFNYLNLKDKEKHSWNFNFINNLKNRIALPISNLFSNASGFLNIFLPKNENSKNIIKKVFIGLIIFFSASVIVIIPLLSAADPEFTAYIRSFSSWLKTIISVTFVFKVIFFFLIGIALFSSASEWMKNFEFNIEKKQFKMDAIISGIVLGGILLLYLLFLTTQLKYFGLRSLPLEFKETESLVKNGFWELFFLSGINVVLFFVYYRNTAKIVQNILIAFTLASLLLLISAGQRMFLYVTLYGFSYEKFFASYTVIYTLILFVWLIICLFKKERSDIFKFLIISFIWMYSVSTIFPIEQFVFKANISLSKNSDSRIDISELTMLSNDVLNLVQTQKSDPNWISIWGEWVRNQNSRSSRKAWYEKNVTNLMEK